jgi:hypothetical protein
VLCVALAVGAAAAVFAVVDGVLLRPLPYRDPARLVALWERRVAKPNEHLVVSPANVLDWRARSRAFAELAAAVEMPRQLGAAGSPDGAPEEVPAQLVTPNAFPMLGVAPALGPRAGRRRRAAGRPAGGRAEPRAVARRFGGDPAAIGRTLTVDGRATTVVG